MVLLAGGNEFHEVILADCAVLDLEVGDDSAERVEHRVENQGLQRGLRVTFRGWYTLHDGPQDILHADAGFSACPYYLLTFASEQVYNLVFHLVGICALKVNFVDYRDDFKVGIDGHVEVGYGLGLYTLCRVDN